MKAYQPFSYPLTPAQMVDYQRMSDVLAVRGSGRVPSAPRAITVTPGALKVTLAWEAPNVTQDDGIGWRIYLDTESNLVKEIADRSTLSVDIAVEDGQKHNFFVSSINGQKKESQKVLAQGGPEGFSTSTHLNLQGSVMPNQAILITINFTDTTIDLSWLSQSIKRGDNSVLTLHPGTKSYAGLSASNRYLIYPRILAPSGIMVFTNTDPPSTSPDSTRALNAALDGGIAVDPLIVTTAAGGGSGGGTGGGADTCPEMFEMADFFERGQEQCWTAEIGQRILGYSFKKEADVYRPVVAKIIVPCAAWRMVDGFRVTPCEPVYVDGWKPAYRVQGSTFDDKVSEKVLITVDSDEYDESNYWLFGPEGKRLLIHNSRAELPC